MTDGVVLLGQLLESLLCVLHRILQEGFQLTDDLTLLVQVGALSVSCSCVSLVAGIEELVASFHEALPEQFALFARYDAGSFPFLLESDELVACLLPLCAVSQFLSLFHQYLLLLEVLCIQRLECLEELSLLGKESVIDGAETLEDLDVHLLRSKSDGSPFLLHGDHVLGNLFPLSGGLDVVQVDGFHLLAEGGLCL